MENLGYTRITAPLSGTVVSVPVDEGQTVNATQSTPTIAQIADLGTMELYLDISEGDITAIKPGMNVSYTILGEPDEVRQAVMTSIDPGLTTLSNGTYKTTTSSSSGSSSSTSSSSSSSSSSAVYYYGKALVDNADGRLRIGMTVQASIVAAERESALTVPLLSVEQGPEGKRVQVLNEDGTSTPRAVVTGISDKSRVEIVSGLREGETVVAGQVTKQELEAQAKLRGPGGPH
jgi:membrane fusion protein, macrolide-specific efflux system